MYQSLFEHEPETLAADRHPEYLSSKLAREWSVREALPLIEVQHHHAHIASCLADNDVPLDAPPVLGIALDGLGFGDDGTFWGGEFLLADYCDFERVASFRPVAMIGGAQAMREPWRNTYAHLAAAFGWADYSQEYGALELTRFFENKPLATFEAMLKRDVNCPLASSCGRLFDAVAAAIGVCREHAGYEGQAAIELEALAQPLEQVAEEDAYPFRIVDCERFPCLEPEPMWRALLGDLLAHTPPAVMAARFHKGLAQGVVAMVSRLSERAVREPTIALSGGVFQNKILLEEVAQRLRGNGRTVLTQRQVPANDGGLSLGQAAIAAARSLIPRRWAMCLGIPGQIVEVTDASNQLAVVNVAGVKREINISCVVNEDHPVLSCVGDWVLVHVGFAMSRIDEDEAMTTLQLLTELGEMQAELQTMQTDG